MINIFRIFFLAIFENIRIVWRLPDCVIYRHLGPLPDCKIMILNDTFKKLCRALPVFLFLSPGSVSWMNADV